MKFVYTFILKYQQSISEKWGFLMDNPVARLPYKELEPWHYYCDNIVALLKAGFQLNFIQTLYKPELCCIIYARY